MAVTRATLKHAVPRNDAHHASPAVGYISRAKGVTQRFACKFACNSFHARLT
jgi:hypothetical protein